MMNLLCMVKDVSYSEEDLNFTLTSTIGNNLASKKKKKKKIRLDLYPRTLVVLTSTIGNNLASKKKKNQIGFISTYSGSASNVQS